MKNNIFRKKSLERISSPDQLNDYIRVSNPSVWLILSALIIIVVSAFIWALSGRITTEVTSGAIVKSSGSNNTVVCYIRPGQAITLKKNMEVHVSNPEVSDNKYIVGRVGNIIDLKLTRDELMSTVPDAWSAQMLMPDDVEYAMPVIVTLDMSSSSEGDYKWVDNDKGDASFVEEGKICKVSIITESVSPINFLINNNQKGNGGAMV